MTTQTETPAQSTPLQPLAPVSEEKNLLGGAPAAGSCCGGSSCG